MIRFASLALLTAIGILAVNATSASAAPITYELILRGESVVDPAGGDLDGWVNAYLDVDPIDGTACPGYGEPNLLGQPTEVHLHEGAAGTNGPVVASLDVPAAEGGLGACIPLAADRIAEILADPASFYVDHHTDEYPNGALRAQLGLVGCSLVAWGPGDEGEGGRDLVLREGERAWIRGAYWDGAVVEFALAHGPEVVSTGSTVVDGWGHDWFFDFDFDDAGDWTFRAGVPGVAQCEDVLVLTVEDAGTGPTEPLPLPNAAVPLTARTSPSWIGIGLLGAALVIGSRRRWARSARIG